MALGLRSASLQGTWAHSPGHGKGNEVTDKAACEAVSILVAVTCDQLGAGRDLLLEGPCSNLATKQKGGIGYFPASGRVHSQLSGYCCTISAMD